MHLVADISGHGWGHLAQAAPVLRRLHERRPDLRITLRSPLPETTVDGILGFPVERAQAPPDPGLEMNGPIKVDRTASAGAYAVLHLDWARVVEWEIEALAALAPDLLFSDITYASLPAARALGVPTVALSSLNWDGLYGHYCGDQPDSVKIRAEISAAYNAADVFLQITPHMAMGGLTNAKSIGPVGRLGTPRRETLLQDGEERLVVVTFGGIGAGMDYGLLPRLPGLRWILPEGLENGRADAIAADRTGVDFIDLIASADAVVTKMGYGTMVEAACNGTRILYADRPDWPEMPAMADWLTANATAQAVPRQVIESGDLQGPLSVLLGRPVAGPPRPTGVDEAVDEILKRLDAPS